MKNKAKFILIIYCIFYNVSLLLGNGNMNNFEMGTAIYRDLASDHQWVGHHWHAGIFKYFTYSDNEGKMYYIEMDKNNSSTPNTDQHHVSINLTTTNYANELSSLKNSLIVDFRDGVDYHGTYSRIFSPSVRYDIISTANSMRSTDNYCMGDMINPKNHWQNWPPGWYENWNGKISDIAEIRCDGIVEYAYEKNNISVSNSNNISHAGNSHVDAHNNLHDDGGTYHEGELCPRIQAGENHGGSGTNRSEFDPLVASCPMIENYSTQITTPDITQITFRIKDNASTKSYVLIKVRKSNQEWHILKDNTNSNWKFKELSLTDYSGGYQYDQFYLFWDGHYTGGYYTEDGNYQLKIVAIDQGANYTEQIINFYADIDQHELSLDLSKSGTSTINAIASGGSNNYTDYIWWYRNDDGVALKNTTKAPPTGQWIYNSSWNDQTSVNFSPSYNWSIKCQVTDSDGDTAEDTYSEGISPNINNNILVKTTAQIPDKIVLLPNSPNPFNPTTKIKFGLPNLQKVSLSIYSLNGDRIKTLVNSTMSAGYHSVSWDATSENGTKVSSGIYIYQLKCGNEVFTQKMIFTK